MSMFCSLSAPHSMLLLLQFQSYCLSFILYPSSFFPPPPPFLPHAKDPMMPVLCWLSAFHSMFLLLHFWSHWLSFILFFFSFLLQFFFFTQSRCSFVNAVFTFNPSLIASAPSAPILLPVICSFFLFFLLFSFFPTLQIQFCQRGAHSQYFTHWFCSFISNPIGCHSFIHSLTRECHYSTRAQCWGEGPCAASSSQLKV